MIKANTDETFIITTSLIDELEREFVPGQTVSYDVRDATSDAELSPPMNGTLPESTFQEGMYKKELSIPTSGEYVCYVTCSGFLTGSEDILISQENIYDLIKSTRHGNISVEDVIRENETPTASQTSRNVPLGKTDFVITKIKNDIDTNWGNPTSTNTVYAWYRTISSPVPYKMGADS